MLSYIDSARAGALDAGHAYAAGGRRAPEAENGVLMGGTKADASQRFDDFPGEQPSQGEIERWVRNARSKMTDDQKAVVRGAVPAKLLAETTEFDLTSLPALPSDATTTPAMQATRSVTVANYTADNARKKAHRAARILEIKSGLGDDMSAALETNARLLLAKIREGAVVGDPANKCFDGLVMFKAIDGLSGTSNGARASRRSSRRSWRRLRRLPRRRSASSATCRRRRRRRPRATTRTCRGSSATPPTRTTTRCRGASAIPTTTTPRRTRARAARAASHSLLVERPPRSSPHHRHACVLRWVAIGAHSGARGVTEPGCLIGI